MNKENKDTRHNTMKKNLTMKPHFFPLTLALGIALASSISLLNGAPGEKKSSKPTEKEAALPQKAKGISTAKSRDSAKSAKPDHAVKSAKKKSPAKSPAKSTSALETEKPKLKSAAKPRTSSRKRGSKVPSTARRSGPSKGEKESQKLVSTLSSHQRSHLLQVLNEGNPDALVEISGIGTVRGDAITKARPLKKIEDLRAVKGVGVKVFEDVIAYAKTMNAPRIEK